jgi:ribosomal protein S18 acetylase RimI-like enzyme
MKIVTAEGERDMEAARRLFQAYETELGISLCFQGFATELATLPGAYAPPRGRLLLAKAAGAAVGCVALRPLADGVAEMKRLYLAPGVRGKGVGRSLVEHALAEARDIGYSRVRLDTFATMSAANALYDALGFKRIDAYYDNPLPGAIYKEIEL